MRSRKSFILSSLSSTIITFLGIQFPSRRPSVPKAVACAPAGSHQTLFPLYANMIDETQTDRCKSCFALRLERRTGLPQAAPAITWRKRLNSRPKKVIMADAASMREEAETIAVKALAFVA